MIQIGIKWKISKHTLAKKFDTFGHLQKQKKVRPSEISLRNSKVALHLCRSWKVKKTAYFPKTINIF